MLRRLLVGALVLVPGLAGAQEVKKNPTALIFTCPDHATDTDHEIDIVDLSGTVIQTIQAGDPPAQANGDVVVPLQIQPVAFGSYQFVVRAVGGTVKSVNSQPSETWERAPGQPGRPRVP